MRVFRLHLTDLFLAVTALSQFGFLGFGNKERHPGFRIMLRHRRLESTLRMIFNFGRVDEYAWLRPVYIPQERLYRL